MKILWGPYNHEKLDILIQEQLIEHELKSFGPNGADELMGLDDSIDQKIELWQPDLILLVEPLLRLFPPKLLKADAPIMSVSSLLPMQAEFFDLFNAWIYLWNQPETLDCSSIETWLPIKLPKVFSATHEKIYSLACTQNHIISEPWREALNALDCVFLQDLLPESFRESLQRSRVVFVPDQLISFIHFEVLAAGAYLFYPADASSVACHFSQEPRAIACTPDDFQDKLDYVYSLSEEPIDKIHALIPGLDELLVRLLRKKMERCLPPNLQAYLFQTWSRGPLQEELVFNAFHSAEINNFIDKQPLLKQWYCSDSSQEKYCYCLPEDLSSNVILPIEDIPTALLKHFNKDDYRQWQQLSLPLLCYRRGGCAQAKKLPDNLTQLIKLDLKQVLDFLDDYSGLVSEPLVLALLESCPDNLTLRKLLFQYDATKEDEKYLAESIRLLDRTLVWQEQSLDFLGQCLVKGKPQKNTAVLWHGPVDSFGSFQCVNHALLQELGQSSAFSLSLTQDKQLPVTIKKLPDLGLPLTLPDVLVSHTYHHSDSIPLDIPWVKILPWEYGMAPIHWVRFMQNEQDEIWVPSQFNKDVYVRSGVDKEKIHVIPNGVDTKVYKPEGSLYQLETEKTFKFLYVGGALHRKGFDILIKAYCEAFGPNDDVCLVIKDFGTKGWYANQSLLGQALKRQDKGQGPEILIITEDNLSDSALAALYRACDVYVHPYRGEGFGMGILESMSCGTPPIIPSAGPAPEFCPETCGWQIPVLTHFMHQESFLHKGIPSYYTSLPSFIEEPDLHALKAVMKQVVLQSELRHEKGRLARQQALKYDWAICADLVKKRLHKVAQLPEAYRIKKKRLQNDLLEWKTVLETDPKQALIEVKQLFSESIIDSWELPWLYVQALYCNYRFKEAIPFLKQAIALNLPYSELIESKLCDELLGKPRVYCSSESKLPLSDLFQRVSHQDAADIVLSNKYYPGRLNIAIELGSSEKKAPFVEVWKKQGPTSDLAFDYCLPDCVDFSYFEPQKNDAKGVLLVLSVIDWKKPYGKQLLQAYIQLFSRQKGKVKIVLLSTQAKAGLEENKIKQSLKAQKDKLPSHLEFVFKSWPEKPADQKALYKNVRLMVNVDAELNGLPLLIAQAMGIRVISTEHLPYLNQPYVEPVKPGDFNKILWLIPRLLNDQHSAYNGIAVRSHVKEKYDLPVVRQQVSERLLRAWLLECLKSYKG